MSILLCAATELEILPTIQWIQSARHDVSVLITGVGMMAAAYSITRHVQQQKPHFIVQAGIAGSMDPALSLCELVQVATESIGDLGVEEADGFRSVFDLQLQSPNEFPWREGFLINPYTHAGIKSARGVTVNEVSTSPKKMAYYAAALHASVESMEGAALHYVALQERIPFLQLRSISNFAGERDKSRWKLHEAIACLNSGLTDVLPQLIKL